MERSRVNDKESAGDQRIYHVPNPDSEKGGHFFTFHFLASLILCIVEMKNESSILDRRKRKKSLDFKCHLSGKECLAFDNFAKLCTVHFLSTMSLPSTSKDLNSCPCITPKS